jgi:hypothetical protein
VSPESETSNALAADHEALRDLRARADRAEGDRLPAPAVRHGVHRVARELRRRRDGRAHDRASRRRCLGINLLHGMTRFFPEYETGGGARRARDDELPPPRATTGLALLLAILLREPGARLLFGSSAYGDALVLAARDPDAPDARAGRAALAPDPPALRRLRRAHDAEDRLRGRLKVWFLWGLGLAYLGVLWSVLGGEAAVAGGTLVWILRRSGLRFSWPRRSGSSATPTR